MKRIVCLILMVLLLTALLCGCNQSMGFGNFNWKHVHFTDATEGHCATVTKWHDNSTGIEIDTEECGAMFLSEGSYILFENEADCPFCGE